MAATFKASYTTRRGTIKAVAMKAETTLRPLFPACASTLRMK